MQVRMFECPHDLAIALIEMHAALERLDELESQRSAAMSELYKTISQLVDIIPSVLKEVTPDGSPDAQVQADDRGADSGSEKVEGK